MNNSREKILDKLNKLREQTQTEDNQDINNKRQQVIDRIQQWSLQEKIDRLRDNLENVYHAQVYDSSTENYLDVLRQIIADKGIQTLLYAANTDLGQALLQKRKDGDFSQIALVSYNKDIEDFKNLLFQVDASVTTSRGAIAETGSLIFWPNTEEPRLMSLVPPIHIAILEADKIYNTFLEVIVKENWQDKLPTNALLISGPSKTADIEFVLTFGVHGPKEFIVILINS